MGLGLAGPFPQKIPILLFFKHEDAVLHSSYKQIDVHSAKMRAHQYSRVVLGKKSYLSN